MGAMYGRLTTTQQWPHILWTFICDSTRCSASGQVLAIPRAWRIPGSTLARQPRFAKSRRENRAFLQARAAARVAYENHLEFSRPCRDLAGPAACCAWRRHRLEDAQSQPVLRQVQNARRRPREWGAHQRLAHAQSVSQIGARQAQARSAHRLEQDDDGHTTILLQDC